MRLDPRVERWRVRVGLFASGTGDDFGAFIIPGPRGRNLCVIASSGDEAAGADWEHVSVSLPSRLPNWPEMCFIKCLFWDPEDVVMQLHLAQSKWINNHPYCLHMWRPLKEIIPLPPAATVGIQNLDAKIGG